jgi:hypothetical protein
MPTPTYRLARRAAIALLAAVVAACTQFAVRSDRSATADFARYRTFAWMPIADAPPIDQDTGSRGLNNRLYSAVEQQLQRDGYVPAASADADLLFTFRILREDGYDDAHVPYAAQWHPGAYVELAHASDQSYERGTLIVDAVDRREDKLVWRGSASARLLPHLSYEKRAERAEDAVAKIFATFPVRTK